MAVIESFKIQSDLKSDSDICRIGLSDGSMFSFSSCYLPQEYRDPAFWSLGRDLGPNEEDCCRFAASCFRAERLALRLVSRAEQTTRGIFHKLLKRGFKEACAWAVISHLSGLDIVNDQRYAELWLRSRLSRGGSSPRRLLASLHSRGIDRDSIQAACKLVFTLENELALLVSYVKKKHLEPEDDLHSFKFTLKCEGFSSMVLEDYLENLESGQ
ncbi:MAG: recombination regulator RecX [Treponema sp.]|jgi:regulatory protein|nr:recombination regulator RecX [Treponema sp.]